MRGPVWLLSVVLAGCAAGEPSPGAHRWYAPVSDDAGAQPCRTPAEGCPCEPGAGPVDCYVGPVRSGDGSLQCGDGTRYCRDGHWGACESITTYSLETSSALVTGPDPCNPCDPRCFVSRDVPSSADLTPGRSSGVSYDPARGGITITPTTSTTPAPLPDSDRDGVPDVADECPGPGAFRAADGSCYGTNFIYHTLPYGGPPAYDPLVIQLQIRTADVYFLMDTTGSMGGELSRLQRDLTSGSFIPGCSGGIIGAIRCTIPDAWFGVGFFDDYPVSPYGGGGDFVYRNVLDIQSSLSAAQSAVNSLAIHWGNDGPESNTQALYAVASGGGLGSYLAPRTGCPAGGWGYPCFRDGTIPIVIHITDAPFHNGPGGAYPYSWPWIAGQVDWATTIAALRARNVRVITVQTCGVWSHSYCLEGERHARDLGNATGSLGSSGAPYVFRGNSDGSGLSRTIVDAVVDLANYSRMNITARAVGDTYRFTQSITATSWGPRGSCTGISGGTTFIQCLPGTDVNFRVTFQNTSVMPTAVPQVFTFYIEIVGNGTVVLSRVPVRIVVPPVTAGYGPSGSYWRDYDSTLVCASNESPDWLNLEWSADVPSGTRIEFEVRAASTAAALPSATPVARIVVPTATSPVNLGATLRAAGYPDGMPYVRVTAVLYSNTTRTASPTLRSMAVSFDCVPSM